MEQPKIVQIVLEDRVTYGLGDDSKVYRWNHGDGMWMPYWVEKKDVDAFVKTFDPAFSQPFRKPRENPAR